MAKKTDSAAPAGATADKKATAKDLKTNSTEKVAIGNKAGATAQVGDSNVDVDVIDRIANSPENGIPEQERKDLDVAYFRDRLIEEMKRLEEERDYLRRSASDMDGNLPEDAEGDDDTVDLGFVIDGQRNGHGRRRRNRRNLVFYRTRFSENRRWNLRNLRRFGRADSQRPPGNAAVGRADRANASDGRRRSLVSAR